MAEGVSGMIDYENIERHKALLNWPVWDERFLHGSREVPVSGPPAAPVSEARHIPVLVRETWPRIARCPACGMDRMRQAANALCDQCRIERGDKARKPRPKRVRMPSVDRAICTHPRGFGRAGKSTAGVQRWQCPDCFAKRNGEAGWGR